MIGQHPFHAVGDKYVRAVLEAADAIPLLIPALGERLGLEDLLQNLDGILFTGSPSNVEPYRYNGASSVSGTLHDSARDATTLPLIPRAIAEGIPLFGICRGFQELNVALGGSLHQHVHEIPGRLDHREPRDAAPDVEYGAAHAIAITQGGLLARLSGLAEAMVNSLHHQGVDRLAPDLKIEARAPDGQIEAVSLPGAKAFLLGVQWHPEWAFAENPLSRAIFAGFGASL